MWKPTARSKSQIETVLTTWLRWHQQYLCAACPPNLHILACLAVESHPEHQGSITGTVERLRMDRVIRSNPAFALEKSAHLHHVALDDLVDFFVQNHETLHCTQESCFDLAEVIYRKTGGHYDAILALLQQRQTYGWDTLLKQWQQS